VAFVGVAARFLWRPAGDNFGRYKENGGMMFNNSMIHRAHLDRDVASSTENKIRLAALPAARRALCVIVAVTLTYFTALAVDMRPAEAQNIPKSLQQHVPESTIKKNKNAWTVGIVGGLASGTYMRFAVELAQALDDGDNLRILPIVSFGAASNLDDLLYLRGIDIAVTQSDVFEYFRTVRGVANLNERVNYIIRLPTSEVHIMARNDIHSIEDLRGKKVNLGPVGSASSLTGAIVFQRLGIKIEQTNLSYPIALQKLKSGELSALIRVVGKPVDALTRIPENSGFHLLAIPFSKKFADYYTIGEFSHKDYPTLVPAGQQIDTIAVPAVLAVYDWPEKSDRFRRVKRFVERLFENWDKFQHPPYHPKWRDVNLAATVPGWTRFSVADEMLKSLGKAQAQSPQALKHDFEAFLNHNGAAAPRNNAERDALFRQFLSWRQKHAGDAQ
jgi:TRAP transporter TAXI family solute receptor